MKTRAERVVAVVAGRLGLEPAAIVGDSLNRQVTQARFACGWIMENRLGLSGAETARRLGYKEHTTLLYGMKRIEDRRAVDPAFDAWLQGLGDEVEAAERAAPKLGHVEAIAQAIATNRRAAIGARVGELQLLAEGFLALLEACRAAEAMILTDDEQARAAFAEAILEEMAALRGDHTQQEPEKN